MRDSAPRPHLSAGGKVRAFTICKLCRRLHFFLLLHRALPFPCLFLSWCINFDNLSISPRFPLPSSSRPVYTLVLWGVHFRFNHWQHGCTARYQCDPGRAGYVSFSLHPNREFPNANRPYEQPVEAPAPHHPKPLSSSPHHLNNRHRMSFLQDILLQFPHRLPLPLQLLQQSQDLRFPSRPIRVVLT
jgi:hypothetical protein